MATLPLSDHHSLSPGSSSGPSARRVIAYLRERFAPETVVGIVVLYLGAMVFGKAVTTEGALTFRVSDVLAVIGVIAFFLLARVFDEHKDFDFDVEYLPERPLPRGSISWREVNGLGVAAVVIQVATCLLLDGGVGVVCLWWGVAMAYLVLTRFEFFVRTWLRRHFVVNTVTHLPVYAVASIWVAQIGAQPDGIVAEVALLSLFAYVRTFGFDLWRKVHAPDEERPGVESYTHLWGLRPAVAATGLDVLASSVLAALLLHVADAGELGGYVALGLVIAPLLVSLPRFARVPTPATNAVKRNCLALALLGIDLVLAASIMITRGVG